MARYDYKCPECGTQFEVEHPMTEHPEVRCPECNAIASQVFGASSIVFKGSGFYNTDQRGKGSSATSATSASSGSDASSSSKDSSSKSSSSSSDTSATSSSSKSSSSSD